MAKIKTLIGIDEVGRGPWAGPLVAAAVILPANFKLRGLKDSKQLSAQQRNVLAYQIRRLANGIGIGWVENEQLDRLGLTLATTQAMSKALGAIHGSQDCVIIIDGKYNYLSEMAINCRAEIKADQKYACVMAAAIVAKVARDNYMQAMAQVYPGYGFERHVGYGTARHRDQLAALGPTPLHRLSFKPLQV